ncbi:transglycosylase SLT domain-containing protein [Vibrio hippocampi]|nr:transglycosylase SLT domain-containing protein [Vibrio hippocampi]
MLCLNSTVEANTLTSLKDKQLQLKRPLATISQKTHQTTETKPQSQDKTHHKISPTLSLKAPLRLYSVEPKPVKASASNMAIQYIDLVQNIADDWQQDPALVMAVIHAESYFQPQAQSAAPAYGLMQVMFDGAVAEVSRFYFNGKTFSLSQILQPDTNITIGTAYLYILNQVYLKTIQSDSARRAITIAAYNCGLTRLMGLMAETNSLSSFVLTVNSMSDDQVLHYLTQQLPIAETRHYVTRVLTLQQSYQSLPFR